MTAAAIVFAATAGVLWGIFLRPVPVERTTAQIKAKTHKPAGTYWQQQVGVNRGFRTPTPIAIDESYVLELYIDQFDSAGYVAVPPADEGKFQVGQRVSMEYQRRGLPLFGYRTTVLSVQSQPQ